ncbi:hypothetical protein NDU88_001619 [Pleurodeles waltl]|uniref:Uncharacterized protein n=1 Tax=Pleurodeles waltl TaxID=8319 RepID=A0AAV7SZV0_PLEWA|nr:hypothetical protein NDU88_001619 [Pleurodeles waltl]
MEEASEICTSACGRPGVGSKLTRHPGGKFRLPSEMTPWTVVRPKGTLVTAQKDHESVTRNISFFKPYRSDINTAATVLVLPLTDTDGGESETSHFGIPEQDVHTPHGECVESQEGPHGTTAEGREGDGLADASESSTGPKRVVSTPPRGGSKRYHLRPRLLPSSKLRVFLAT